MGNLYNMSFRHDKSGNGIKARRGEEVCDIIQLLFNMVPGADPYEPKRGLGVSRRMQSSYIEKQRDTEYEGMIREQLTTYTEILPVDVMAVYVKEHLYIYMKLIYDDVTYEVDLNADRDQLSTILRQ